jgi:hypothetical protein
MADADYPSGDLDATNVSVTYGNGAGALTKRRSVTSLADPYVADARIRLASVEGVYRVPVSIPDTQLPKTAFGELEVAEGDPELQLEFPYNANPRLITSKIDGSGSVSVANSLCAVSTGTTIGSEVFASSARHAKCHPGQGLVIRFTALFDEVGTAGTEGIIGFGNEEDGVFFGYEGATFGVLHRSAGEVEFQTLTITNGATTAGGTSSVDVGLLWKELF